MDPIGPLPKSVWGHEYIFVIINYATQYPEAIPLHKGTSKFNQMLKHMLRRVVDKMNETETYSSLTSSSPCWRPLRPL